MVRITRVTLVALLAIGATLTVGALAIAAPPAVSPGPAITATPITATPAPIFVTDVKCSPPSSDVLQFTPPLSPVLQPTVVQKQTFYRPCTAPANPNLTSGTLSTTSTLNDMCSMVLLGGLVTQTITWNTGQTTTMSLNRTATITGTTLTVKFTGTVIAGLFTGSQASQTYTASAVELINCLNGAGTVAFIVSQVNLRIYH
jgi:hypothetical protein